MNIFKISYKVVRQNNDEIYKGFGFKHHSDATQYYVHPNNQSFSGTTTLCQPIGEALILFSSFYSAVVNDGGTQFGDAYFSDDGSQVFIRLDLPDDWRENGVVSAQIYRYEVSLSDSVIRISAYDALGRWIDGDMNHLRELYKLLPAFFSLLVRESRQNAEFNTLMLSFIDHPAPDAFVNLHEDFYQNHKFDEYELNYDNLSGLDYSGLLSFRDSYANVAANKLMMQKEPEQMMPAARFPLDSFSPEYHAFIPRLPPELVIPKTVLGICSAITHGDVLATLFHGPSGTGKTVSCKLVCQEIGLPIMEVINCTENLDEFVLGKYLPENDRIVFKESFVTKAIREGGAVVFEEINFAKPQYLAFLNSLLDSNGFVRLDNGDVVRRHRNFRFFATMNLGYFGTKELNQALYNRFDVVLELAGLADEAIIKMLTARVPECANVADKMLGVYHKLKRRIDSEELDLVISPRNLENWARMAKYEGYLAAAERTIIPIAKCDRMLEDAIRGILMLYKWI